MGSEIKLKPCRECRHEAKIWKDDFGYFVRCIVDFCDNCTEYFDTAEEAAAAWNQRNGGGV